MKKTKLLTPILATATIGGMVAPLVTLASCNKGNSDSEEEITLDDTTEKTTTANSTMTTYTFNLKNKLNWETNDEETTDEVDAEIEDIETEDDVTVEISALQYDAETGKFYVTVTTSKEDGTLNEDDTVQFSLNLHCHKKGSKTDRWARKFTKFVIKYSSSQLVSGHFDDTDVTKRIKFLETDLDESRNFTTTINLPATDTWKSSSPAEGEYDLSKLNCYVLRDIDSSRFLQTVTLPEYSEAIKPTLGADGESIDVKITGKISELAAKDKTQARFTLLFTYPDKTVFQTIGGFSVNYVSTLEEPNAELVGSREQHYYTAKSDDKETASNFIAFYVDEDIEDAEDLSVELVKKSTNDTTITFGNKYLLESEVEGKQIFAIAYTLNEGKENYSGKGGDMFNVALNVKYTDETEPETKSWTEQIKGLTFTRVDRYTQTSLLSYDATTLSEVNWTNTTNTTFNDVIRTCFPYGDLNDFTLVDAYADFEPAGGLIQKADVTFRQLGYLPLTDHYSVAEIATNGMTDGTYSVKIQIRVITWNAAYIYTLNCGEVTLGGE